MEFQMTSFWFFLMSGVSLIESFTAEQIKEHIKSLKSSSNQGMKKYGRTDYENKDISCSLCDKERITFTPTPHNRFCAACSNLISPTVVYYSTGSDATAKDDLAQDKFLCRKCFSARGRNIKIDGIDVPKSSFQKKQAYESQYLEFEPWVQCDRCKAWQHQICSLFNKIKKKPELTEYLCPTCILNETEDDEKVLNQIKFYGAKDLPTSILSDHIEQWLSQRLKNEREERAHSSGKGYDEVQGAEDLCVREVSSVDKIVEVKQFFRETFQDENYQSGFPYKSKVVLLFQKIENVDVLLFAMYAQEYGTECPLPNRRHVCLSYLDSVKYFRPEIRTVNDEALRTYVYHEVLLGYLDYCKKSGFTSCYIWVSPPKRGDSYILNCHPETQKTPDTNKLREWFNKMIHKAVEAKIVVSRSNLYDDFFKKKCNMEISATHLPYFDHDHWPYHAELILKNKQKMHASISSHNLEHGITLRSVTHDANQTMTREQKDAYLMHELVTKIKPKENFIVIHLQHSCNRCCEPILSGKLWASNLLRNFKLCEQCYDKEKNLKQQDRDATGKGKEHEDYYMVEVEKVPAYLNDKDKTMSSEILNTREEFLAHCQQNHYEFGTLRRAKYSSMMILHHLHTGKCQICSDTVEPPQSWQCMSCSASIVCDSCYQKEGAASHVHQLVIRTAAVKFYAQSKKAQTRIYLQSMLRYLDSALGCSETRCNHEHCNRFHELFSHCRDCTIRASQGYRICKQIGGILTLHARNCKNENCRAPHCSELKVYNREQSKTLGR